jgi:hypothetical protein
MAATVVVQYQYIVIHLRLDATISGRISVDASVVDGLSPNSGSKWIGLQRTKLP